MSQPRTLSEDWSARLRQTQEAFDSVAVDYDGPRGNNACIQDMRAHMWRWLDQAFGPGSRLIDIGCGTGLDAVRMAKMGHKVMATDWSDEMVRRTRQRAADAGVSDRVSTRHVGAHELSMLQNESTFDGAYSNLGPLNCVPNLGVVARECARLLNPGGLLVFTVIGRVCPWEVAHYALRLRWSRISVRFARRAMPVGMNQGTIWTFYYTPRELYRAFSRHFTLEHYRGVCLFTPPPYITWLRDRHGHLYDLLWRLDERVAGWPGLRAMGDHFLIMMRKRPA